MRQVGPAPICAQFACSTGPAPFVFIVDDDIATRRALVLIAESGGFQAVGYGSAEEFLDRIDRVPPGCVVVDLHLPGMSGRDLLQHLAHLPEPVTTIVVTGSASVAEAVECMRAGAMDLLTKPVERTALIRALGLAVELDVRRRARHATWAARSALFARLTRREREVFDLMVDGRITRQIAANLHLSVKTIEVYRTNLRRKLHAESLADVLRFSDFARRERAGSPDGVLAFPPTPGAPVGTETALSIPRLQSMSRS